MRKIMFLGLIAISAAYSCKNRAVDDVNQSPGAYIETVPDRGVIKQSDTAKLKQIDSINSATK
jgi:hypothetical protein